MSHKSSTKAQHRISPAHTHTHTCTHTNTYMYTQKHTCTHKDTHKHMHNQVCSYTSHAPIKSMYETDCVTGVLYKKYYSFLRAYMIRLQAPSKLHTHQCHSLDTAPGRRDAGPSNRIPLTVAHSGSFRPSVRYRQCERNFSTATPTHSCRKKRWCNFPSLVVK